MGEATIFETAPDAFSLRTHTQLRSINLASFPILYNEAFYKGVCLHPEHSRYAYWKGQVVGAVCTQLDPKDGTLYIMTLAVLAAYRSRGIGSQLLQSVLEYCKDHKIPMIKLHVHIINEDAIRFYTERFGFTKGDLVENYYRRIDPPHCYLLYKRLL